MVLLNLMKMTSQSCQSMLQREYPPTYIWLIWTMLLLPLIVLQLMNTTILMNLILIIYTEASEFENVNLVIYFKLAKAHVPLDLSKFQFMLPDSPLTNSRANNAIVFGMRIVSPY